MANTVTRVKLLGDHVKLLGDAEPEIQWPSALTPDGPAPHTGQSLSFTSPNGVGQIRSRWRGGSIDVSPSRQEF
jgi:hypothetical protein